MTTARTPAKTPKPAKAPLLGKQGSRELSAPVFGESFHGALVHEAVRAELAARRRGTASTKTRGKVRGGGEKPWRQKGTGRARAGSIRSPLWAGGGVTFGPSPRHYTVKVNRKARRRALRAALSLHAERASVAVVEAATYDEPNTHKAAEALDRWDAERPVLVVLSGEEEDCAKSFRNIDRVAVRRADDAGVADLVWAASLVVSEAALERLVERAQPSGEGSA